MKYVFPLISMLFVLAFNAVAAEGQPEFRAMWVSSYGSDADMVTPENIDHLIADAKRANLNALIVQVRKTGDALYDSDYEPRAENLTLPDFDPLEYIIKQAHTQGIEVHAWINTYKIWGEGGRPKNPNHVFNDHPEWISKSINGKRDKEGQYALDPGAKPVQDYLFDVYMEVVRKYDVDGIHFDYCRYWDKVYGYSDLAVSRFNRETGRKGVPKPTDPVWSRWRRDQVTALVRRVYEGVKETKPWVKVTAAVICSQSCPQDFRNSHPYKTLFQDWERWTREGIVDAVIPMNYKSETNPKSARLFRDWIAGMVRWKHDRQVYNGILIGGTNSLLTQIAASRKRGTDGVVGFAFNRGQRRPRSELVKALAGSVFSKPAPVPEMAWKDKRGTSGVAE